MLKLKTTALAVLALGSSAVFAGTMGPVCAPGNVTVPCERSAWDFGAQALYLQPSYAGYNYVGMVDDAVPVAQSYGPNLNWAWGFMIEGSYHFSTGNDMNINWYHWNNTSNATLPNNLEVGGAHLSTGNSATFKPRWDAANFEFGQHVDFGEAKFVRFHGGVQYARLNTVATLNTVGGIQYNLDTTVVPHTHTVAAGPGSLQETLTYNGFGPRFGADMFYGFGNGLNMYGKLAGALLVGPQGYSGSTTVGEYADAPLLASGSTNTVVPELETKLGGTYTYSMAQGDISLDAGWMWVNYFNAFEAGGFDNADHRMSNFSVQGPYIGLQWVGNVA